MSDLDFSHRAKSEREERGERARQDHRPGEHTGERRLRLLRRVLGEEQVPRRRPSGGVRKGDRA
jgi:hypothetical protein